MQYEQITPKATYSPWLSDVEFQRCYAQIRNNTMINTYRCYELWSIAKQLKTVEGYFLEVGVWRGGSGALLASAAKNKKVYLADTFSGIVKAGDKDPSYSGGELSNTSEEIVQNLISSMDLDNITILKGIFPDETAYQIKEQQIALLHCDVDTYKSTKDIIRWAISRLKPGSVIIFDDYGFEECKGVTEYVNELMYTKDYFLYIHNLNGHAILIRRWN